MNKINKCGICPNCNENWDDGDIMEVISKLDIFVGKNSSSFKKLAANFGWNESNKTRFSKAKIVETIDNEIFIQCHNNTCNSIFDTNTGEYYKNWQQVRNGTPLGIASQCVVSVDPYKKENEN